MPSACHAVAGIIAVLLAATIVSACDPGGEDECNAYADNLLKTFERCSIPLARELLLDVMRCPEVMGVLDAPALQEVCYPELAKLPCAEVLQRQYPAECLGQFIYPEVLPSWVN